MPAPASATMTAAEEVMLRKDPVSVFQIIVFALRQYFPGRVWFAVLVLQHVAGMNAKQA